MRAISLLSAWLLLLAGCAAPASTLRIAGSTSVQPLAEVLAEAYVAKGGARVSIQGGGSTAGVQAVLGGVASMGAISRPLAPAEVQRGLVETVIGYDVLTVVVHPSNPVAGLSSQQLRGLFSGDIGLWQGVGGRPGPVHLVTREAGSGSREAFRELVGPVSARAIVQNSSGAIRVAILDNPQAIGYVSLGVARMGGLKTLAIDGRQPGAEGYRLIRPLSLVTRGLPASGEAFQFLQFTLSPAGQHLVELEGLVPAR